MWREYPKFQPDELLEYLRKSQSDDASLTIEEVLSRHEKDLKRWQDANLDAPISESNIYREVKSGESISAREEFNKLLKRIESPNIKAVLVVDCSRLGRPDTEEIGRIINLFRYTKTLIITPQRTFDLNDEWDRDQFEREMMRGRDYLEYTKKALGRGKENSLRDGWYINAITPYGYEREWIVVEKRRRPTLKIVEEEADIVSRIFDWYVNEGIGATKICQRLNTIGIKARKGALWKKSSVINILKNEHYTGKIVIKKHIDVKTVQDQKITKRCLFNKDYEIVEGRHPAIIDEDLFYRANNKISKHVSTKPNEILQNPFASILKCECGRCMRRAKDRHKFRYLCDEQMFCGNASIQEDELIPVIIKHLQDNIKELTAKVTDSNENKKEKHMEYVSLLESKYIEQEKKELSLWDKYSEEKMPKQIFDKLMAECMEKKRSLKNELESAYNETPVHIDYKEAIASLHEAIESLSDVSVPASIKNKVLKSVVDKIVYKRDKPMRMTTEQAKEKGVNLVNGWYRPKFELEIYLKI